MILVGQLNADEKDVKEAQVGTVFPSKSLTISSFVGHTFTLRRLHDDALVGFVHVSRAGEIFTAGQITVLWHPVKSLLCGTLSNHLTHSLVICDCTGCKGHVVVHR